jgi:hypothetical protein
MRRSRYLPPGTLPPLIINYSASSVPILQLGLSGKGLSEQRINDLGTNFLRIQLVGGIAIDIAGLSPAKVQSTATTGKSMFGKISVGVREMTTALRMRTISASTTNV